MPAIDELQFIEADATNHAKDLRRVSQDSIGVGVFGRPDFRVTFTSGLTVGVANGIGYMRGQSTAEQGMYRGYHGSGSLAVTLTAAHATLPRLDQIVLRFEDANEDSGAMSGGFVDVVTGTATAGATLDNRSGAASLYTQTQPTMIRLADVLVNANNSPALSQSNIRDRRPFAIRHVIPPLTSDFDIVQFIPSEGFVTGVKRFNGTDHASRQAAALCYLPRRIAATRLRWRYQQDPTTAVASGQSYRFAVCDASGRYLALTAITNFQGATSAAFSEVITFTLNPELPAGYVFEAGNYYVWFGLSAVAGAAAFGCIAMDCDDTTANGRTAVTVNQFYELGTGGTTFPATNTITGLSDVATLSSPNSGRIPVPLPALSIG